MRANLIPIVFVVLLAAWSMAAVAIYGLF